MIPRTRRKAEESMKRPKEIRTSGFTYVPLVEKYNFSAIARAYRKANWRWCVTRLSIPNAADVRKTIYRFELEKITESGGLYLDKEGAFWIEKALAKHLSKKRTT